MPPRIDHFRQQLINHGLDAALISKKESIYYLAGLAPHHPTEREAYLLISPKEILLYHSPFIDIPAHLPHLPMSATNPLFKVMSDFFGQYDTLGLEKNNLTASEFDRINQFLPQKNFQTLDQILIRQRLIKDEAEQHTQKKAGQIANRVINWCQRWLKQAAATGISEQRVALEIDYQLKKLGADEPAFPTIVAFDQNTAKPHHQPNHTRLKTDSIILIDMGASFRQYKSDLTRTWLRSSKSNPLFQQIQDSVSQAYLAAVKAASSPSVTASAVDTTARNLISQAGFADNFIHTTGHGIGLEAHELPHINSTDTTPLSTGVSFTIEPGIYLAGKFGYRHENTFIMTEKGALNITSSSATTRDPFSKSIS